MNNSKDLASPLAQRLQLHARGFQPIPCAGKKAVANGWTAGAITPERIASEQAEYPAATNTGLRTGALVGVDIDLEDARQASEARALILGELGPTPFERVGRKGCMLCYASAEPIGIIHVASSDRAAIEILGQGQQFVAFGEHPDTGQAYQWIGEANPLDNDSWELPRVTSDQLRALAPKLAALLARAHASVKVTGDMGRLKAVADTDLPPSALPPLPPQEIIDRLAEVDPSCDRATWRDLAGALRATPCTDPNFDKRALFSEWSRHGANFTGTDDCEMVYDTMRPKVGGVASGTFIRMTNEAGYAGPTVARNMQSAAEVFGAALALLPREEDSPRPSRFSLLFPTDMRRLPDPTYAVDQIVPDSSVTLFYGASGSLKTFLVLDLLASTAAGLPAFQRFATRQGSAVLCAGEAPFAIARRRWPAFVHARKIAQPNVVPFAIVPAVPLVSAMDDVCELIATIRNADMAPRLVAIDTVARAAGGLDENDARSAGQVIAAAEHIRNELGCAVVLVHHAGKDENRGARGSSALAAGMDAIFRVARARDTLAVTLRCEKMKDADETPDIHLHGEGLQDSLVFHAVSADEYAAATRANPPLVPGDIGKALQRAGAVDGTSISTSALASTLVPDAEGKALEAMEKRLQRGAAVQLAAFAVTETSGRRRLLKWTFPQAGPTAGGPGSN